MAKKPKRSGRGSNMGSDYQRAKETRDTGKKWLTMPDGWTLFSEEEDTVYHMDFLPYEVKNVKDHPEGESMTDNVWYRFPYRVHRNVGPQKVDLICPQTFGLPCPRCERVREIYNDVSLSKKKAKALAGKYTASRRSLYIVKIVGGKGEGWDKKIKNKKFIFDTSDWFFFKLLDKEIGLNDPDTRNFACLEAGYTLHVRFSSDSFEGNSYAKPDRIDFKARKDYPESVLEKNPDLGKIIKKKLPTYQEMVEADESSGSGSGKSDIDMPDEETLEDMDFDELAELIETMGLNSEIDIDDYDEDDDEDTLRDDIREAFKEMYGDLPSSDDNDDADDDGDEGKSYPDQDVLEDMDFDELVDVVESFDLDDEVDLDDFDEDEDDDEDELREAIMEAINNKIKTDDGPDEDSLEDEIDDADDFKQLKQLCKENDVFEDIDFKKFKKAVPKLKKKMLKALKGSKPGKSGGKGGKCPHGHTFGEDWGDHDECTAQDCKQYKACWKKNESNDIPF